MNPRGDPMMKIDCFGDICPVPLIKIQHQLDELNDGDSFMLVVDHSCVVESISEYYDDTKHVIELDEVMNGVWEITITKNGKA
jgi:TusA-related sulfurtransferase